MRGNVVGPGPAGARGTSLNTQSNNVSSSKMPRKGGAAAATIAALQQKQPKGAERVKADLAMRVAIPDRTVAYLDSLLNPWKSLPASIPLVGPPSQVISVRLRGTMVTGTNNDGFILCNPLAAIANDDTCVSTTNAAFSGTGFTHTGVVNLSSNSPYATADIGDLAYRVVSCGVRTFCTNKFVDLGGSILGICQPGLETLSGVTFAEALTYVDAERVRVDSSEHNLVYFPCEPTDYDYRVALGDMSCMGIYFQGPSDSLTADFEFVANIEVVGYKVLGAARPRQDSVGVSAVTTAIADHGIGLRTGATNALKAVLGQAAHYIADQSTAFVGPVAGAAIKAGVQYVAPQPIRGSDDGVFDRVLSRDRMRHARAIEQRNRSEVRR